VSIAVVMVVMVVMVVVGVSVAVLLVTVIVNAFVSLPSVTCSDKLASKNRNKSVKEE
jgi:hypothetical protein